MPTNRPTTLDLLEAVMEFLEKKVMPKVPAHIAFHTRVAVNALKIVQRETELGPRLRDEEYQRLRGLLGMEGNPDELNAELCRRIRNKELDAVNLDLVAHLRQTTLARLSIDNPDYSAYKKEVSENPG